MMLYGNTASRIPVRMCSTFQTIGSEKNAANI